MTNPFIPRHAGLLASLLAAITVAPNSQNGMLPRLSSGPMQPRPRDLGRVHDPKTLGGKPPSRRDRHRASVALRKSQGLL